MSASLTCPVCKTGLTELERQGVSIDVCPQCRGVWLDRGELEKLSGMIAGSGEAGPPRTRETRGGGGYVRRYHPDDEDGDDDRERYRDRYHHASHKGYKKKQGLTRLLDFFD